MPLPVEALTPTSSMAQINQAIQESIELCQGEGQGREVCSGRVYRLAEKATGKSTDMLTQPNMSRQMQAVPPSPGGGIM